MRRLTPGTFIVLGGLTVSLATLVGQSRDRGANWTTTNSDAQRTGWVPSDPRISTDRMQRPGFQFLWKLKLANLSAPSDAMTPSVIFPTLSTFRGRKAFAVVGGGGNNLYAVDVDLGRVFWSVHFNYAIADPESSPSVRCPGGITSAASRPTTLAATVPAGPGTPPRITGRPGGAVGEPGQGAAGLIPPRAAASAGGGAAPPAALPGAPASVPVAPAGPQPPGLERPFQPQGEKTFFR